MPRGLILQNPVDLLAPMGGAQVLPGNCGAWGKEQTPQRAPPAQSCSSAWPHLAVSYSSEASESLSSGEALSTAATLREWTAVTLSGSLGIYGPFPGLRLERQLKVSRTALGSEQPGQVSDLPVALSSWPFCACVN